MTSKTRRLAAIVAGDAVGYSRLMDRDEKATLAAFSGLMEAVVEPVVHQRGGRIFKTTGDGFLAVFGSASEATQCSLDIQHRLAAAEWSIGDTAVVFRLAVHLGDVFETGEDVYGTAVNVAARLQRIADPGGVAISGDILHQLEPDVAASFTSIGVRPLKNIGQAVEVARWNPNRVAVAASGTPGTYLLPGIMAEVRRRHPDIELGVTITNSHEAWQVVMAQHADMALTGGIANLEGLADEVLTNDEIVVVGPAGGEDIMTAGDLSEETWIVREQGSASRHTAEEAMAAAGINPTRWFELPSWETVKLAVAHGLGYSACSRAALEVELRAGVVRIIDVPGWRAIRPIVLQLREGEVPSSAAHRVIDAIRSHLSGPEANRAFRLDVGDIPDRHPGPESGRVTEGGEKPDHTPSMGTEHLQ